MGIVLPSKQVYDYCKNSGWDAEPLFKKGPLHQKYNDSARILEPLSNIILEEYLFAGFSFYPISQRERTANAFWDCMGETTYKPSNELLLSVYCSHKNQKKPDNSLIKILRGIKQGIMPLSEFPHESFDKWDITVHQPDGVWYEGDEEPEYAGRFVLKDSLLKNAGLYSQEEAECVQGWGYPNIDTLLLSTDASKGGSFFKKEIYIYNIDKDCYKKLKTNKNVIKNINFLLKEFSKITASFNDGVFDHEHQEKYDFGDATDAAIALGEAIIKKPSKLRLHRSFSIK